MDCAGVRLDDLEADDKLLDYGNTGDPKRVDKLDNRAILMNRLRALKLDVTDIHQVK